MQHIAHMVQRTFGKMRDTERGEIMKYFCKRLNIDRIMDSYPKITMGHMGKILEQIPTKDLYYLKRVCDDSKHFSKRFWWELDPEKHPDK
jgi:hypothetical protein